MNIPMKLNRATSPQWFYLGLLIANVAQANPGASTVRFGDHPAESIYRGTNAAVNLQSHPEARTYRTRLREAAKEKPSFAGHYIVAEWGCGTCCQQIALIDAKTGTVYFAPFTSSLGNQHRLDSRLMVVDPPKEIVAYYEGKAPPDPMFRTQYYVWDETKHVFVEVPSKPAKSRAASKPK
jgi:hypothetical protein